jgi:hypothetical protein
LLLISFVVGIPAAQAELKVPAIFADNIGIAAATTDSKITNNAPPTLVLLGTEDKYIPVATGEGFQRRMKEAGGALRVEVVSRRGAIPFTIGVGAVYLLGPWRYTRRKLFFSSRFLFNRELLR